MAPRLARLFQRLLDRRPPGPEEAQRYPADYDGIVAGAPAINWTKLHPEQLWGSLVMLEAKNFLCRCASSAAATAAAIAACDGIDGVKDGVIEDPARCTYDPKALVGTVDRDCGAFTEADADDHQEDLGRAEAERRHRSSGTACRAAPISVD